MLLGRCVDPGPSSNLKKGEVYYLFPHGVLAYYASRFPRAESHFGAYQRSRFELVTVDAPTQAPIRYLARVVKPPSHFYQVGEEYIITEPRADGYYSVFFKHRTDAPIGAYTDIDCFERIEPFKEKESEAVVRNDKPKLVQKTADLVNDKPEIVHVPTKQQKCEQLSLF